MKIQFTIPIGTDNWITYCSTTDEVLYYGKENTLRMLKGIYSNKERLEARFLSNFDTIEILQPLYDFILSNFDKALPFSYKEAFEIRNESLRRLVFRYINIPEMIQNLGAKRLKVDGIEVTRKCFDKQGNLLPDRTFHSVYETYEIEGDSFFNYEGNNTIYGDDFFMYAVKCWCTTTNKEHWIWIDEQYKDEPLEAIASTFQFHENVIPHIKELKRQGDIMIVELNQFVDPKGEMVPLTAEQYFNYLTIET